MLAALLSSFRATEHLLQDHTYRLSCERFGWQLWWKTNTIYVMGAGEIIVKIEVKIEVSRVLT